MRADRLISVLMLLQRRGRITAAGVAQELEISERTARRDLEALALAGVPVYSCRGRGGGWRLVDGARTDLSGLTATEARGLFQVVASVPDPSAEVRRALAKLFNAVPETFRDEAVRVSEGILVDGDWRPPQLPALSAVQEAIAKGKRLEFGYTDRAGRRTRRAADPWGVVVRPRAWYFVAGTNAGRRTFRVDRIDEPLVLDQSSDRPDGFDLAATWADIATELRSDGEPARLTARARTWVAALLSRMPAISVDAIGPVDVEGWQHLDLSSWSAEALTGLTAAFGPAVEVTGPDEAQARLAALGASLAERYKAPDELDVPAVDRHVGRLTR